MAEFQTPTDIGNRALQHCGQEMMDPVLGFTEISKAAAQVSFAYGKLRRAELERNIWTFATRRAALRAIDTNTMLLSPSLWVSGTTYFAGSIVNDGSGTNWVSNSQNNLGNQPQNSTTWDPYFGPLTVTLYDSTQTYFSGELVYTTAGDGTYRVFVSLESGNSDNPAIPTVWGPTVTYTPTQVVTYSSVAYMSLINFNLNQEPDLSPAAWSATTTYSASQKVYNPTDGLIYSSIGSGNLNHNPATDGGVHWTNTTVLCPWASVFTGGIGSLNWLEIGGAEFPSGVGLSTINIGNWPLGSGPWSQSSTKNLYRLPSNYLRDAPQDPKAGSSSYFGAPSNSYYNDWLFESGYLVTADTGPIILRFVADMQNVSKMKTMFCEGLAARIAAEICEPLTQSTAKLGAITAAYNKVMGEARTANAIEEGAEQPPMDDFLACRY